MLNLLYLIFISLIIIILSHYGLNYFKNTFITDKHDDILSIQAQKYKEIIDDMTSNTISVEDELLQFALDECNK